MKKILFVLAFLMSTSSLFSQTVFTSTCGYTVTVFVKPIDLVFTNFDNYGYNYKLKVKYDIILNKPIETGYCSVHPNHDCGSQGQLDNFQFKVDCLITSGQSHGPINFPKQGVSNSGFIEVGGQYLSESLIPKDKATVETLICKKITINISGPGLPDQTRIIEPGALPIELLSFDATANQNQVDLTWVTGSEKNNDFFTIERTVDGIDFEEVGKVAGQGNSSIKNQYSFTDFRPKNGVSYYRLRQTDYNGESEYFEVKSVNIQKGEFVSNVYPNPAVMNRTTVFIEKTKDVVTLNVRNVLGQLISSKDIDATSNDVTEEVELIGSDKMYFIELIQNNVSLARYKVLNN